jgi:pimeloyl-ACP methyl ester carboxylesterase
MTTTVPRTGYAPVHDLQMYYEIHGTGHPLVLLHGAFMTIDTNWGDLLPALAERHRVIAVETQGHGRTADIDRPLSYEQMAEDVAALLAHLDVRQADVLGYSLGGGIALQVAIRHPALVRKLIVASASFSSDGMYPEVFKGVQSITSELFVGTPMMEAYERLAPNPEQFPVLVERIKAMNAVPHEWAADAIEAIVAPTMIIIGDSDGILPEHAVDLFRLRGGGVFGDLAGLPASQLAVLPGTTHVGVMMQTELLLAIIAPFLDAAVTEGT